MMQRRRWSDHDRNFGPFTYARDSNGQPLGIVLDSGADEYPHCQLRIRGFGHTLIIWLPAIIKPWRQKIKASSWDAATIARIGRDWYYDEHASEYGFQLSDGGFFQVYFGAQTHDSRTTKSWSYFLPWTQWRFFRHSIFDLQGNHFWTELATDRHRLGASWYDYYNAQKFVPKAHFAFNDYDGKRIIATTHIQEREWRFGEKAFKWLSIFRRPMVRRSLDLDFNEEVGPEKGSWKGGTTGHSIEMLPGELHEAAFRRYCEQVHHSKYSPYKITFVGRCDAPPAKPRHNDADEGFAETTT